MHLAHNILAAVAGIACAAAACGQTTTLTLPTKATFLRTNSDSGSLGTTPLLLSAFGLEPGDHIRMRRLGDFKRGPSFQDDYRTMIAVFSTSSVLLASNILDRVPGAIDVGDDFTTANTFNGGLTTNIAQDFLIGDSDGSAINEVCMTVPARATHLFIASHDSLYNDNSDPDADFKVEITLLDIEADFDGDGVVGPSDLAILLGNWGGAGTTDLDGNGATDSADLATLLGSWGDGCAG